MSHVFEDDDDESMASDGAFEVLLDDPMCMDIIRCLPENERMKLFLWVAYQLYSRWEYQQIPEDINRSIEMYEEVETLLTPNHPDKAVWFNNFGMVLLSRFEQTGSMEDLEHVIKIQEAAVASESGHGIAALSNLAIALQSRFERNGSIEDLDRAISTHEKAITMAPEDFPDRATCLTNLGEALRIRFKTNGTSEDLTRAIDVQEEAIASMPDGHPNRASFLNNLASSYQCRFEQIGTMDDLDLAIGAMRDAVAMTPAGDVRQANWLNNLGISLGSRFERNGSEEDLNDAIRVMEQAVVLTPPSNVDRADSLQNLGLLLLNRFDRTGSPDDVDRAIKLHEEANSLAPIESPDKGICLNNLGNSLQRRFERFGSMDDLNRAIKFKDEALAITPDTHLNRAPWLNDLGIALQSLFERTGLAADLDHTIAIKKEAVDATPEYHPDRDASLDNLGIALQSRFSLTGSLDDLDDAIKAKEEAVMLTPDDHPHRAHSLNNLGISLHHRFEKFNSIKDLDDAITMKKEAVARTPPDNPDHAARLTTLGISLEKRFEQTGSITDLEDAIKAHEGAANCVLSPPTIRIRAASSAAGLLINRDLRRANSVLRSAVELLPYVSPRTVQQQDRQYLISQFVGLTSEAASLSLACGDPPYDVLRILELGRGVLANMQIENRSEISALRKEHPKIALRIDFIRNVLDRSQLEIASNVNQMTPDEIRELSKEMDGLLVQIRQMTGYEQFLRGPSQPELQAIAKDGPIIVFNVSRLRSDVIVVEEHGIRTRHLPQLVHSDLLKQTSCFFNAIENAQKNPVKSRRELKDVLEWLWTVAVSPVFEMLGIVGPPSRGQAWRRVWWIANGLLSLLPIHAAGFHDDGSGNTVIDRVVSSYTPTIKALAYARERAARQLTIQEVSVLVVGMPQTPGKVELKGIQLELEGLQTQFKQMPFRSTTINSSPTRSEILIVLKDQQLVHFSCHGLSASDPSKSTLLLMDWKEHPLTVSDIVSLNIERGQFAYLSACHTSGGRDMSLLDESINLSSAIQLAGFPSVVGTLWQVMDAESAEIAPQVYGWLFKEGSLSVQRSAEGLHHAIREVRERSRTLEDVIRKVPSDPIKWAPYIHIGV